MLSICTFASIWSDSRNNLFYAEKTKYSDYLPTIEKMIDSFEIAIYDDDDVFEYKPLTQKKLVITIGLENKMLI